LTNGSTLLHPLFALRYSATHRSSPNLIYRLTPFEAYRRNLVKKIQVWGVTERDNFNEQLLVLRSTSPQNGITATVATYINDQGHIRTADITLKKGDDLYSKTNREEYKDGYRVEEIDASTNTLHFENGLILSVNDTIGPSRPEIFRLQIEKTIEQHMETQQKLEAQGIKVLSLFFIDRVANYTNDNGIIKQLFDEAFNKLKPRYERFRDLTPVQVRTGYFAKKRSGEEIDTDGKNGEERQAEQKAFELIMRDKEQLLTFEEKTGFIFAHSALREGWDNPNVFQICTLNLTVSEVKKRQEIGRGLRLCVNQNGERLFDDETNILTIIANESYQSYASKLQQEYVEDGETEKLPPPSNARKNWAKRNDKIFLDEVAFRSFWEKLSSHVTYHIHVNTNELINTCVLKLNRETFPNPVLVVEKGDFVITEYTFKLESVSGGKARIAVETINTRNETVKLSRDFKEKDKLGRILNDERLRRFEVLTIIDAGDQSRVIFEDFELDLFHPRVFQSEAGQKPRERASLAPVMTYPVFNLLDRTARETGLTRPTVNAIFKQLQDGKKQMLFKNPEGFAGVFISVIKNTLADHVTEHLEFKVEMNTTRYDLEELFPPRKAFPQKELIDAGENGLYDQVQIDSDVETRFVEIRLRPDDNVIFYFKFPPLFKIQFPKLIGNYNPDWGIVRYDEAKKIMLQLIRETKGSSDLSKLQFPQERRKILCAQKHFNTLGIAYRHVTDSTLAWWQSDSATPEKLGI
jgi:type III restriction enzyme